MVTFLASFLWLLKAHAAEAAAAAEEEAVCLSHKERLHSSGGRILLTASGPEA